MTPATSQAVSSATISAMLAVTDIQETYELFCSVFGFAKVSENGNPVRSMVLARGDTELHLRLQNQNKSSYRCTVHVLVSNIEMVHNLCEEKGLTILRRLQKRDYGLRSFVFEDYDGNRINVGQLI